MEPLTVSSRRGVEWTVVDVTGELDIATRSQLSDHINDVITGPHPACLILDFSRLEFCDASGLTPVVTAHHQARARRGWLRLVCPEGRVRRLLRITGLSQTIPVYDTLTQAAATTARTEPG
jgi:anti-sigma B factor antagonist